MDEKCLEQLQTMNNQLRSINAALELIAQRLCMNSSDTLIADLAESFASLLASSHIPE